jgi:hypothetical protein
MAQTGDESGLTREPLLGGRIERVRVRQNLDRHRSLETGVDGFVDLSHAARADEGEDFVRTELVARLQGHAGIAPIIGLADGEGAAHGLESACDDVAK